MDTYEPDAKPDVGAGVLIGVAVEITVESGADVIEVCESVEVDGTELSVEDAG